MGAPESLNIEPVIGPTGRTIYVNPDDPRGASLGTSGGDANPHSLLLWSRLVAARDWDVVVDVGANYGEMLAGVDLGRAKSVIAFEPSSSVLPYLRRTVEELPWDVDIRSEAVSHSAGRTSFTEDISWSGRSGLEVGSALRARSHETREYEVAVTALDDVIDVSDAPSVCIKVDVEGTELDVVTGAAAVMRGASIVAFFLEIIQLGIPDIAYLARSFDMYVFSVERERLIRLDGTSIESVGRDLFSSGVYAQDAILVPRGRTEVVEAIHAAVDACRWRDEAGSRANGKRVVYTAIMGGYEDLVEQPMAAESDIDFVCFTDNQDVKSSTWKVVQVEPRFPGDPIRSARSLKIVGHPLTQAADETLWIDNRVVLKVPPTEVFDLMPEGADVLMLEHSFRSSVREEFDAVLDGGYDDAARISEQLFTYSELEHGSLSSKPYWTGLMVRRNNARTRTAMSVWLDQVLRYSRRDQLSVRYALAKGGVRVTALPVDNRESEWHEWLNRRSEKLGRAASPFVGRKLLGSEAAGLAGTLDRAFMLASERRRAHLEMTRGRLEREQSETRKLRRDVDKLRAVVREYEMVKKTRSFRAARRASALYGKVRRFFARGRGR